jgi:2-amino-4-hydroxy-6-hydroxymethyldihydropteridine diphosphokinase
MGDRLAFIRRAVAGLPDVAAVSPVYETEPVGGPPGQDPYLNVVVELSTDLSPRELLEIGARLEAEADRRREVLDGPRTLDVDILLVGEEAVDEPDLRVPHPRMWQRRFVLAPLHDLAPELVGADRVQAAGGDVRRLIDSV